jgi:uracil-DNA glycosylase family 4
VADTQAADAQVAGAQWDALALQMRGCVACPELAASRSTVVVGTRPAGQLLDELLEEAGLPRAQVAVANVLKCRPPGNRRPARVEIGNCRGWLTAQIRLIDPPVICALGGSAAAWFFGPSARIGELRGQPHPVDGRRVVVTYHPSAAIRFGPAGLPRAALREDLALVAALWRAS